MALSDGSSGKPHSTLWWGGLASTRGLVGKVWGFGSSHCRRLATISDCHREEPGHYGCLGTSSFMFTPQPLVTSPVLVEKETHPPRSPHPQAKPSTGSVSIQLLSPFSESRKIPLFAFIVSLIKTDVSHGKSREVSPIKKESHWGYTQSSGIYSLLLDIMR